MEEYIYMGLLFGGVAYAGYKLYTNYLADGQLTLDEVQGLIEDVEDIAEAIKELPSLSEMKKMKKDELKALCEERGLETDGLKADLLSRLKEL